MNLTIHILILFSGMILHPLHVTLTNVETIENNTKCEITIKIFKDDFETVIQNYSGVTLNLGTKEEIDSIENHFMPYINDKFSIIFDGEKMDLTFINRKENFEAIWITLNCKYYNVSNIKIKNKLLIDLYEDQKNLVIFKNDKIQQGIDLDTNTTEYEINF